MMETEQLEACGFSDIVISIKSSDISEMTAEAELVSAQSDYPLHLGVSEAGDYFAGLIKNSMGIGALLLRGIGDTIRVSLTDDPVKEIYAAMENYVPEVPLIKVHTGQMMTFGSEKRSL